MRQWLLVGSVLTLGCTTILGLDKEYGPAETANSGGSSSSTDSSLSAGGVDGAGGGSTGNGGGSGGAGGAGGSGGQAPPPPEDCTDGVDNDGDMQPDCADEDCKPDYECVDPVPTGFTQHVRMRADASGAGGAGGAGSGATCPDGSTPLTYLTGPAEAAECSACSCSWKDAACSSPQVSCFVMAALCSGGADYTKKGSDLTCDADPSFVGSLFSCRLTGDPDLLKAGTCSASTTQVVGPAWGGTVDICPVPEGSKGCDAGQVCVPKSIDDFSSLCIENVGILDCPAGWTSESSVLGYEKGTDSRSCSSCMCDTGAVTCEGGYFIVYDGDNCSGSKIEIKTTDCVDVTSFLDSGSGALRPVPATPTKGTCTGGTPAGKVTPGGAHTICCK